MPGSDRRDRPRDEPLAPPPDGSRPPDIGRGRPMPDLEPPDARSQGKATKTTEAVGARRHLEGSEQGPR